MGEQTQGLGSRLLINRDFGLLFLGRLVSQIGDGIHYFALAWLVLDLTGSGTALGTMLFASSVPAVILAPFSGVLADLWNRKAIVVSMDVLRGLILLTLALIFKSGYLTISVLYAATVLSSLCGVLFGPAISAAIPGLVEKEELVKANSLNNLSRGATMIAGPVLGAFLVGAAGYFGVFLINGTAFLLSALSELFIRFPKMAREDAGVGEQGAVHQFLSSLKNGFTYIWESTGLKTLIFFAVAINFLAAPVFGVILPYLGKEIFLLEAQHFGTVQAGLPVGFLLGTAVIGALTKRYKKGALLALGIGAQGLISVFIGVLALPAVFGIMSLPAVLTSMSFSMVAAGVFNTLVNVPFQVMLQETVPDSYRGRVFGLLDSMVQMLVPISTALSGVLVDTFTPSGLLVSIGLVIALLGLGLAMSPSIKELYGEGQAAI